MLLRCCSARDLALAGARARKRQRPMRRRARGLAACQCWTSQRKAPTSTLRHAPAPAPAHAPAPAPAPAHAPAPAPAPAHAPAHAPAAERPRSVVQAHFRRRHARGRRPVLVRGAAPLVYAEGGAWRLLALGEAAWVGGAELAGLWEMLGEDGQALGAVVQGAQEPPFMVRFHAPPPPPQRPRTLTLPAPAHEALYGNRLTAPGCARVTTSSTLPPRAGAALPAPRRPGVAASEVPPSRSLLRLAALRAAGTVTTSLATTLSTSSTSASPRGSSLP
jgi:hypothetical protein